MRAISFVLLGLFPVMAFAGFENPDSNLLNGFSRIFEGEKNFSISMLKQVRRHQPNGNLFFSPFSTYNALLLAYFGSSGVTEKQLYNGLNLKWSSSKEAVRSAYRMEKVQSSIRWRQSPLTLSSANRIFVDESVKVQSNFQNRLYDEIKKMDFRYQPEKALREINDWIANKTYNQIQDMLNSDEINDRTLMILANAAYLKGDWISQFDEQRTSQKPFYMSSRAQEPVPMMQQKGTFKINYNEELQVQFLDMPYRTVFKSQETPFSTPGEQSDVSMLLLLPTSSDVSLNTVISKLDPGTLEKLIETAMAREVELSMPKFEFEQRMELTPILGNMGITNLFTNSATFEDLTSQRISIDEAQHLAKIKVDEKGSTAAAATILFVSRSARPADPSQFNCDHPFLFLIYDHKVKSILFTGVYSDPKSMKY
ncbi:serine protease inhibitor 88Ea [Drosophila ficusphila]|uniref:serine protease inhibitor 88Ea n=1 Tax=Drosophila ficusphila TaxID=30025 RepID=UPI0007E741A4|nr:serine protease inhibitor 88Ea [Drosophila ficusphila]